MLARNSLANFTPSFVDSISSAAFSQIALVGKLFKSHFIYKSFAAAVYIGKAAEVIHLYLPEFRRRRVGLWARAYSDNEGSAR